MSSMTKAEFRNELKLTIPTVNGLSDTVVDKMIDVALRAYSDWLPQLLIKTGVSVVAEQEYDLPSGTIKVTSVKDSTTKASINFRVEKHDDDEDKILKLGTIQQRSYIALQQTDYYQDPLVFGVAETPVGAAYSSFDIEYTAIHTMGSISETGLETLKNHVEYQAYKNKAQEVTSPEGAMNYPVSISDSDGVSNQSVSFSSAKDIAKYYSDEATKALELFNQEVQIPYITKG